MKIYTSPYPTRPIPDESIHTFLFQRHFDDYAPTTAAYIDAASGALVTRRELKDTTLALAHGLRSAFARMGGVPLARGDTVLVFAPNCIAFPVMMLAGFAAGLRMSLANAAYTPRELAFQGGDSRAKAMLVHPTLLPVVLKMFESMDASLDEVRRRVILMDWVPGQTSAASSEYVCMSDLIGKGSLREEEKFDGAKLANETTLLCYSSGTTGKPKGVEITHRTLVSILISSSTSWPALRASNPKMLGFLPFYHIFGAVQVLLSEFFRAVPVVAMAGFEPGAWCAAVARHRITHACVVPPVCLALLHHPAADAHDLSSLEYLMSGAAPLGTPLLAALGAKLRARGADVAIIQGYGLTESVGFYQPLRDWLRKAGSAGLLMPHLEARLVGEDGKDVEEGEPGELWLRGPCMFKGYLRNVEATKAAITEDRWFKTGDILRRDEEGYFFVVDRKKELIKYKGFQVPPAELESVLLEHPEVADVGVVGIFSEQDATELPRAYVVHVKRDLTATEREAFAKAVEEWIKDRVARHKYLRGGIAVVDTIPKSPSGKILRRVLREQANAEMKRTVSTTSKSKL